MNTTLIKFILFFLTGVAIISFIGFGYMLFNDGYSTWKIIGTIATAVIAGVIGYVILKKVRL
jgi:CHASE2 domain-containing sensor protein